MDFLKIFIKEKLQQGLIDLYHFSKVEYDIFIGGYPNELILKPEKFSRAEQMRSSVPRIFFYPYTPAYAYEDIPNIRQKRLYKTIMPSSQIYDMLIDPENIVKSARNEFGYLDQDKALNAIKKRYTAAYMEGRFPVVLVFEPIKVYRVSDQDKNIMMMKSA